MGRIDALARQAATATQGLLRVDDFVREHDVSRRTVQRRIEHGHWPTPLPGVVDVTGARWTWLRRAMAAVLYGPPGTVASHRTAAALHGVLGFRRAGTVEVTVPRHARSRVVPVRIHSTINLTVATTVDDIPTAPLSRTALDLAPSATDRELARVVRQALRRDALHRHLIDDPWFTRAPSSRRLRRFVVRELDCLDLHTESGLEELAVEFLRRTDLPPFVTQHEIRVRHRTIRFDIAWPPQKVALEVDGDAAHGDHVARTRDGKRTDDAAIDGWHVERIPGDALTDPIARAATVARITAKLQERRAAA